MKITFYIIFIFSICTAECYSQTSILKDLRNPISKLLKIGDHTSSQTSSLCEAATMKVGNLNLSSKTYSITYEEMENLYFFTPHYDHLLKYPLEMTLFDSQHSYVIFYPSVRNHTRYEFHNSINDISSITSTEEEPWKFLLHTSLCSKSSSKTRYKLLMELDKFIPNSDSLTDLQEYNPITTYLENKIPFIYYFVDIRSFNILCHSKTKTPLLYITISNLFEEGYKPNLLEVKDAFTYPYPTLPSYNFRYPWERVKSPIYSNKITIPLYNFRPSNNNYKFIKSFIEEYGMDIIDSLSNTTSDSIK